MKPQDIDKLTLPELIKKIAGHKLRIKEHKRLQNLYGGDYVFREKAIEINKNINRLGIELYHYVIKRNILLKKQLNDDRSDAYYKRRDLLGPARYNKTS